MGEEVIIIHKGNKCHIDSYSAFFDNGHFTETDLDAQLKSKGVTEVHVVGLAEDFCVMYTSVDAKLRGGYETYLILDATKGISSDGVEQAQKEMGSDHIKFINTNSVLSKMYCHHPGSPPLPFAPSSTDEESDSSSALQDEGEIIEADTSALPNVPDQETQEEIAWFDRQMALYCILLLSVAANAAFVMHLVWKRYYRPITVEAEYKGELLADAPILSTADSNEGWIFTT